MLPLPFPFYNIFFLIRRTICVCVCACFSLQSIFVSQSGPSCITHLPDGQVFSRRADHLHLNTIHQTLQLVPDVPGSSHGAELDEVLVAPLSRVAALHPLWETEIRTLGIRELGNEGLQTVYRQWLQPVGLGHNKGS